MLTVQIALEAGLKDYQQTIMEEHFETISQKTAKSVPKDRLPRAPGASNVESTEEMQLR
jgi:hypothetical protein